MSILITNIKCLVNTREQCTLLRGKDLSILPCIEQAYLRIEGDQIVAYGRMADLSVRKDKPSAMIDASGQFVLPAWCDSHTHLVFAASREEEFVDKIKGMSYMEIAAKGGGILNSARKLNSTSEDRLFNED